MHYIIIQFIVLFTFYFIYYKAVGYNYSYFLLLLLGLTIFSFLTEINKPKYYQKKIKYIFAPHLKYVSMFFIYSQVINVVFFYDHKILNKNIDFVNILCLAILLVNFLVIYLVNNNLKKNQTTSIEEIDKYFQSELEKDNNLVLGNLDLKLFENLKIIPSNLYNKLKVIFYQSENSKVLIMNSKKINDSNTNNDLVILDFQLNYSENINALLDVCYKYLKNCGYLIIAFEKIEDYERKNINSKYKIIKYLILLRYYLVKRILIKIPIISKLIYILGDKYSVLSRAEVWGRLTYCGFDVVNEFNEKNLTIVIAKKNFEKSLNPNPSFRHLITLNRVGLNGKIIKIHKIRTMYPYSEFIQKKLFESIGMNNIGKFQDDFRITKPGKFLRKYWLDELPQFYDWLRGEIKLVGIRAMSQQFFKLYPNDYKELYLKIKPGIISPIFDEKTAGFDEIIKIEKEYLLSYSENSFLTDIKYFFKTLFQILSGVRSK
jgi:lipopolysaccharide/colanic/teichoic acid biosynthesis glycosyltransferase